MSDSTDTKGFAFTKAFAKLVEAQTEVAAILDPKANVTIAVSCGGVSVDLLRAILNEDGSRFNSIGAYQTSISPGGEMPEGVSIALSPAYDKYEALADHRKYRVRVFKDATPTMRKMLMDNMSVEEIKSVLTDES